MIRLPDKFEPYRHIGIDNGTDCVGLAVCESSFPDLGMYVGYATTIVASRDADRYAMVADTHASLYARLRVLERVLPGFFRDYEPHATSIESPFLHLNVKTYALLSEAMFVIRRALMEYDDLVHFYRYAPMEGKKAVRSKNYKDKEATREAIERLVEGGQITLHPSLYLDDLDEHAIDGISIGYCHHLDLKRLMESNGFPLIGRF